MLKRICVWVLCALALAACAPAARRDLVIEEHLLRAAPDISTDRLVFHFAGNDQQAVLARSAPYKDLPAQTDEFNRRALASFGYELKFQPAPDGDPSYHTTDIYRGDRLIARGAVGMAPISLNASGTDFIGLVDMPDGSYIFTRERFAARPAPFEKQPYAYAGDRLLSLEVRGVSPGRARLDVYLDDRPAYSTDFNDVSVYGPFDGPWTYAGHWALVLIDAAPDGRGGWNPYARLIVDGRDLTAGGGYQQAFQFSVLDGRPFYFYQQGGRIGLSFDGRQFARDYDEVPHYSCCSEALLNPGHSMKMAWFFARRGRDWYYVEAYVPDGGPP